MPSASTVTAAATTSIVRVVSFTSSIVPVTAKPVFTAAALLPPLQAAKATASAATRTTARTFLSFSLFFLL